MKRKLVITKIDNKIVSALYENGEPAELHCTKKQEASVAELGNIYVGKVKNIVGNISAAFVEIGNGIECYYSIPENPTPIFTRKVGKKSINAGDELLVQVSKEAVKTKVPTVTSKLSFTGKFCVLTTGDTRMGASLKLEKEEKERLTQIAKEYMSENYGLIMRTNAKGISEDVLKNEIEKLIQEYEKIVLSAQTRVCFSCLKKAPEAYLTELKNVQQEGLEEIVVEDYEIYEETKNYLESYQPEDLNKLRLYEDKLLPLHKLYNLEKQIEKALKEKVWMKSGAYLVIEPTEALTVIDVNTGKAIAGKKMTEETFFAINMEAAREIAIQIKLRNLSGIILVDFINLSDSEKEERLKEELRNLFKKDSVQTEVVDITKLGLMEITRKKVYKTLAEQLAEAGQE